MEVTNDKNMNDGKKEKNACFPGFGILCAIIFTLLHSGNALIVKSVDLNPTQLGFSRCIVQFLILLPFIQRKHKTVDITGPEGLRLLLWWRGFTGSLAMLLLYFAIRNLSVGNAVTIANLSIIIVPFAARLLLKERIVVYDIIFAVVALAGVVLIAKPTFLFPNQHISDATSIIGVVYAIASAIFVALNVCAVRKLGPLTYAPLNVLYYSFVGSVITSTVLAITGEFRFLCLHELLLVFLIGCIGVIGQTLLTLALKSERAGTVSVLSSLKIIFVYIAQIAFFGDIPSVLSLVGAALILSCCVGIGVRKILNEKKKS